MLVYLCTHTPPACIVSNSLGEQSSSHFIQTGNVNAIRTNATGTDVGANAMHPSIYDVSN